MSNRPLQAPIDITQWFHKDFLLLAETLILSLNHNSVKSLDVNMPLFLSIRAQY